MARQWWKESVVYQIYPRSFKDGNGDGIGDLIGITEKLDYIKLLGADVIWLSPVYKSPNADNGYDISDYQNIMDEFGTMTDFDNMLAKAHSLGLKIVMDLVVNHTSDEHKWFIESKKAAKNAYSDYYIWKDNPNNWGSCFGGSAWEWCEDRQQYYLHAFAVKQPDLNWDNPKVRAEVFKMMNWWCEKGVDGFRMDVISMISKPAEFTDGITSPGQEYADIGLYITHGPHEHEYLKEMNREVLSKHDLITVGETACVTVDEAKKYAGFDANELNMVFTFEHVDLGAGKYGKWTDNRVKLTELKEVLSKWQTELHGKAWNSLYWDNHDQPRAVSRFGDDGKYRVESAKAIATCLHLMQGTPYIYQGEELGMTNVQFTSINQYNDIESINAYNDLVGRGLVDKGEMIKYLNLRSRDNARTPMQWDSSANAGFSAGKPWLSVNPNFTEINAESEISSPDSIFHFYRKLISLRKENEIIIFGDYTLLEKNSEALYVYTRSLGDAKLLCVTNFTSQEQTYKVPEEFGNGAVLIGNYERAEYSGEITLKPWEAFALTK